MTLQKITVSDVKFQFLDEGSGVAILFVHGFPLDHQMWLGQVSQLAEDFRVICPDLPGFGQSSTGRSDEMTMAQYADSLAGLLDRLQVGPVVFCGLSMGGYIGWEFWRRHSDRLKALVACDTRAVADTEQIARGRRMMAESLVQAEPTDLLRKVELIADSMLPRLFATDSVVGQLEIARTREVICQTSPLTIAQAQMAMARRSDFSALIQQISLPTLVVCGQQDQISTPAEMQQISELIPGAEFALIGGAGHLAPLENPAVFNTRLGSFVKQLDLR